MAYKTKAYRSERWMKCVYGLTMAQYNAMAEAQGGRCAICGVKPKVNKDRFRALHVDHDHGTGKVRGLLCHHCNVNLAVVERQEWVEKAKAYLHRLPNVP